MATNKRMDNDEDMLYPREDDLAVQQQFLPQPQMQQPYSGAAMAGPPTYPSPHQQPYPGQVPMGAINHHTTTVVVNQPSGTMVMGPRQWSSTICSCCDDAGSCLLGVFCPCILATQIAQDMDESCCVPCCVPGWLIVLRTKLRMQQNIDGTVMDDCCTVLCCGNCVLCQMSRELKFVRLTRTY